MTESAASPSPSSPRDSTLTGRAIRIFISSTFRDMHAERDELLKRVFPQIRHLCEQRRVTLTEIDLRWGVTDEQRAEGRVLPICLEEIHNSRPYFIGLLGERYGWIPDEIPAAVIDAEPWVAAYKGRSVTELEILHGVLHNPAMAGHAYFYFRDPAFVDRLAADDRILYREQDLESARKLNALKQRVRESPFVVRENYEDAQALGRLVLTDLTELLDRLFPVDQNPSPLDVEASEHAAFEASRSIAYMGRPEYLERLDAFADGEGPPLVVLGESGSGKSALLANWAALYRKRHPETFVLTHFIGASPFSSDWRQMSRRVVSELKRAFKLDVADAHSPEELRIAFASCLQLAAARGRVVLALDALDQLSDSEGAHDLLWLPARLPPGVRLVASTLPSRPLEACLRRDWVSLEIEPLQPEERRVVASGYLAHYRKTLGRPLLDAIASAPQAGNPLFLRCLLEELRVFGIHEGLHGLITGYLSASSLDELFEMILGRYERDYDDERPQMVRDALSLLWASRSGLAEAELLELLGSPGEPLPRADWSPFYLSTGGALTIRSGLLGFFHSFIRSAVGHRYLDTKAAQAQAHVRLADYFFNKEKGERRAIELPWQLMQLRKWEALARLLGDVDFLQEAWAFSDADVRSYWAAVESESPIRLSAIYKPVLDAPSRYPAALVPVARLLTGRGYLNEALSLWEHIQGLFGTGPSGMGDDPGIVTCLLEKVPLLRRLGKLDRARAALRICVRNAGNWGESKLLEWALHQQALLEFELGDFEQATARLGVLERTVRESGNARFAGAIRALRGRALMRRGDLEGALSAFRDEERQARASNDLAEVARALGNQAAALEAAGCTAGTGPVASLRNEEESIFRELGDIEGLIGCLSAQVTSLCDMGRVPEAATKAEKSDQLGKLSQSPADLAKVKSNRARVLEAKGEYEAALAVLHENEADLCALSLVQSLRSNRQSQARCLVALGRPTEAMNVLTEQEALLKRESENPVWNILRQHVSAEQLGEVAEAKASVELARNLLEQAKILQTQSDAAGALSKLKESEGVCRRLADRRLLCLCLSLQARILRQANVRNPAATYIRLLEELEELYRATGDARLGFQTALERALFLTLQGHVDCAVELLNALEGDARSARQPATLATMTEVREQLAKMATLPSVLHAQGIVRWQQGNAAGAVEAFQQAVERDPAYGVGWSDLGICLAMSGQFTDAESALQRASGLLPGDIKNWGNLGSVRVRLGKIDSAIVCFEKCVSLRKGRNLSALLGSKWTESYEHLRGLNDLAGLARLCAVFEGVFRHGDRKLLMEFLCVYTEVLREAGRTEEAVARAEEVRHLLKDGNPAPPDCGTESP